MNISSKNRKMLTQMEQNTFPERERSKSKNRILNYFKFFGQKNCAVPLDQLLTGRKRQEIEQGKSLSYIRRQSATNA